VFSKNRDRLLTTDMSRKVMAAILAHREVAPLLSDEHFSIDGTLIKAWASMKSFQPKPETAPPDDEDPGDPPPRAASADHPPADAGPRRLRYLRATPPWAGYPRDRGVPLASRSGVPIASRLWDGPPLTAAEYSRPIEGKETDS